VLGALLGGVPIDGHAADRIESAALGMMMLVFGADAHDLALVDQR
jgi:hypothetical protein